MERISALMDGELEDFEASSQLKQLVTDESLRRTWGEYHLIGDVLRKEPTGSGVLPGRIQAALQAEPTVLAPRAAPPALPRKARLYALSAAASVAGVAAVAWLSFSSFPGGPGSNTPVVVAVVPTPVSVERVVAARTELTQYLMAHQEYSPSNTMRGVASYIRTVGMQETDMNQ